MVTTENYTGADLSGNDGNANRVLTLANSALTVSEGFQVFIDGLLQTITTDYTVDHNTNDTTVTLLDYTYDDTPITVIYNTSTSIPVAASTAGLLPLNARFIQKNLGSIGNTCIITEISRSTGTDEYRETTETAIAYAGIVCMHNILNESDESVKQGEARAGDLIFWFDQSYENYCTQGNRITYDSKTYQMTEVRKHDATGNITYLIEVRTAQI